MILETPTVRESAARRYYKKQKEKGLCVQCGSGKPEAGFARCRECINRCKDTLAAQCRAHKITKEQYHKLLTEQEGKCAICHRFMLPPCIDHNHTTSKIRKLLCRTCNSCLGLMEENIVWLENMIDYVRKNNDS